MGQSEGPMQLNEGPNGRNTGLEGRSAGLSERPKTGGPKTGGPKALEEQNKGQRWPAEERPSEGLSVAVSRPDKRLV